MSRPWTPAETQQLIALVRRRRNPLTYGQIARAMGMTRSKVIGKMWRIRQGGDYSVFMGGADLHPIDHHKLAREA